MEGDFFYEEQFCLLVYTDGAVSNNGRKNAVGGVGVWFGDDEDERNVSERFLLNPITNQRAELFAVVRALGILLKTHPVTIPVTLHTDSVYVYNIVTRWIKKWSVNGWKTSSGQPVKNQHLIRVLDKQVKNVPFSLTFKHVYGHSGVHGNERADALARAGKLL
tara:strand:+ start:10057 stop:10545 length:489 start_codon:yes stop_codon:yes gene_type:complete